MTQKPDETQKEVRAEPEVPKTETLKAPSTP